MSELAFHFTLGPVQSFVAQARRTRDFWAGSFLLSWLSGVAMAATQRLGGELEFPITPDGYLDWISTGTGPGENPRQGAIPNRFKARVPADFDGSAVTSAVAQAWRALADTVWTQDLAPLLRENEQQAVRTLWDRQHTHFWEIAWVLADAHEDAANLLDRRKNWRHHLPPAEPGVKCMIMEGWQELSGIVEMDGKSNKQRRDFWRDLRAGIKSGDGDLGEREMLCALAFVKRRFARHFERLAVELDLGDEQRLPLRGWKLAPNMPSVAYMAAVHWLEALVQNADRAELDALYQAATAAGSQRDEWDTYIHCLEVARRGNGLQDEARRFIALDGNLFFEHSQQAPASYGFDPSKMVEVAKLLDRFRDAKPDFAKVPLSPFYAVLAMDGDNLGVHLRDKTNQPIIAAALNQFTGEVKGVVKQANGVLIYAGGDDVLALLPLEDALDCALQLRNCYRDCFFKDAPDIPTTLSGAVIYAHVKTALGEVLNQAHRVLDDIAKEAAGRDAIAVRVLKPGGEHLTWAQPWDIAAPGGCVELSRLADDFAKADQSDEADRFSSKFFHRMRERFTVLAGLDAMAATKVLAADYMASYRSRAPRPVLSAPLSEIEHTLDGATQSVGTIKAAEAFIAPLLDQCSLAKRQLDLEPEQWPRQPPQVDAALLVRFLAQKGVEGR